MVIAAAIRRNPQVSLLYRDNPTHSTIIFQGKAHADSGDGVRRRVFDITPEIEQNHKPWDAGVAVIINLEQVDEGAPWGGIRKRRSAS